MTELYVSFKIVVVSDSFRWSGELKAAQAKQLAPGVSAEEFRKIVETANKLLELKPLASANGEGHESR